MMAIKKAIKSLKLLWTDGLMNETALTTYTFNAVEFGPAGPDRTIVVCIGSDASGSTALIINSCSAGGVALIKGGSKTAGSTNKTDFTLFYGKVPSGTSGTVVAVASRACRDCAISVYAVTGKSTMVQTMAVSYEAGTALDFTLANVLKDDVIISGIYSQGPNTYTYNQLTEDFNISGTVNNRKLFSASDDKADADAQPILATASATMTRTAGGSIAFRVDNSTTPNTSPIIGTGAHSQLNTAATTMTINIPPNEAGDMLILIMAAYADGTTKWEANNGWTKLAGTEFGYGYTSVEGFYRKATGASTMTVNKSDRATAAVVHVIKAGTYKDPLDYSFTKATATRDAPVVGPTPLNSKNTSVLAILLDYDGTVVSGWPYADEQSSYRFGTYGVNASCVSNGINQLTVDPSPWVVDRSAAATLVGTFLFAG